MHQEWTKLATVCLSDVGRSGEMTLISFTPQTHMRVERFHATDIPFDYERQDAAFPAFYAQLPSIFDGTIELPTPVLDVPGRSTEIHNVFAAADMLRGLPALLTADFRGWRRWPFQEDTLRAGRTVTFAVHFRRAARWYGLIQVQAML